MPWTLINTAFLIPLVFAAASPGQEETAKYGDCVIELEGLPLPECAVETRNGRQYVLKEFARDVFAGRNRRIAARPVRVGRSRLAWTYLRDGGWSYFDPSGLVVVENVAAYDNGASEFHSGLVLVTKAGKWGLANTRGELVVPMQYDGMFDDAERKGWLACTGCRTVQRGEHSWLKGGNWVRLDERGRLVGKADDPTRSLPDS